jgi:hypothetical protein
MLFPDSEAERLNHYLDARVQGQQVDPEDLDPVLVDAYERVRAMDARSAPDPQLMTNIWRSMMNTIPANAGYSQRAAAPALPVRPWLPERRSWSLSGALAMAIGLVTLLLAGTIGYLQYNNSSDSDQPTTIPAALQQVGTPTSTGCETVERAPGSLAEIVETPQTSFPYLPRYGYDPLYGGSQEWQVADRGFLLENSTPDAAVAPQIERTLQQLVSCRFYLTDSNGNLDMEGRFFALFSDDYFRREFSGYQEAGRPLLLVSYWNPSALPSIVETRRLLEDDGSDNGKRVLAFLDLSDSGVDNPMAVVFVKEGDQWLVDEVGYVDPPAVNGSPVVATDVPTSWIDHYPLQLDIAIHDATSNATPAGGSGNGDGLLCAPQFRGTPIPCGTSFQAHGPYIYNEFPANTDITVTLYNVGDHSHRFEVAEIGISVDLEPDQSKSFVINEDSGEYLFTVYQDDQPDPIDAGVFIFISADEQPSLG